MQMQNSNLVLIVPVGKARNSFFLSCLPVGKVFHIICGKAVSDIPVHILRRRW